MFNEEEKELIVTILMNYLTNDKHTYEEVKKIENIIKKLEEK